MNKQELMKELLERYQQLEFVEKYTKALVMARIIKLERELKNILH